MWLALEQLVAEGCLERYIAPIGRHSRARRDTRLAALPDARWVADRAGRTRLTGEPVSQCEWAQVARLGLVPGPVARDPATLADPAKHLAHGWGPTWGRSVLDRCPNPRGPSRRPTARTLPAGRRVY